VLFKGPQDQTTLGRFGLWIGVEGLDLGILEQKTIEQKDLKNFFNSLCGF